MKTIIIISVISIVCVLKTQAIDHSVYSYHGTEISNKLVSDSDSVKIDLNAPVVSYGNKLYQLGIVIGSFDKKTNVSKGQLTTRIQIYDLNGKAVAEAVAAGVNASFAVIIFEGSEKLSLNLNFDHEAEELALKLRQLRKI